MRHAASFALVSAMTLGLAACADSGNSHRSNESRHSASSEAEAACIAAVNRNMADEGTSVTSSDFSEAGTIVMLRSSDGDKWRCLASNDGIVEDLAVVE